MYLFPHLFRNCCRLLRVPHATRFAEWTELLIPITNGNLQSQVSTSKNNSVGSVAQTIDQTSPIDQNKNFRHTVVKGETVFSISQMYNTTVDEIYRLNPDARESISIGQVLILPQRRVISEVKEENNRYHTSIYQEHSTLIEHIH